MQEFATITIAGVDHQLPIVTGSEGERAIDISRLRVDTGLITLDDGYANTGSAKSAITFIDGEKGILRYRGVPIEDLAERSSFIETAELLIFGELPDEEERAEFRTLLTENSSLHRDMRKHFEGFPVNAHPMSILSAMVNALQAHDMPEHRFTDETGFREATASLLAKTRTIAAASYKSHIGQPMAYPRYDLNYAENFPHMMFSIPFGDYETDPEIVDALQLLLILHADHEQNWSASTVRMVASSGANMFASCAAGVCALWGPLHGGANAAVVEMLQMLHDQDVDLNDYIARVKDKDSKLRLSGFGHRVYKNYDPRASILKEQADKMLGRLKNPDPLLEIAKRLEDIALNDPYFVERRLYPNVDFYSGVILRAMGIPVNMFTVMFAMGRMPGWIANWKEVHDADTPLQRPRQIYTGETERDYMPLADRPDMSCLVPVRVNGVLTCEVPTT